MKKIRASLLALVLTLGLVSPTQAKAQSNRGQCAAAGIGMGLALAGLFFPPTSGPSAAFLVANLWVGIPAAAYGMTACRRR